MNNGSSSERIRWARQKSLLCMGLAATLQIFAAAPEAAAQFTEILSAGDRLRVVANRCNLSITRETPKNIRVSCRQTTKKRGDRGTNTVVLDRGEKVSIKANKCFLVRTAFSTRKMQVRCVKTAPTPTPTVTPTATATATATATNTPTPTPTPNANALFSTNNLGAFNTSNPAGLETLVAVTGLANNEVLVALDRRPQNGFLYGLGFNPTAGTVQLYSVSSVTGQATAIGSTGTYVDNVGTNITIGNGAGTKFGFDFNPTVDRIRVVNSIGQNFRMNPNTGAFVDGDLGGASGSVTGLNPDGNINGAATGLQEVAYTNNQQNTSVTSLYTLDQTTDQLCIQNPPNAGTQASCLALSPTVDSVLGFDILPGVNVATSNSPVTSGSGVTVVKLANSSAETLSSIDLTTGALSTVGTLGSGSFLSLAVQAPAGVPMVALSNANQLLRFSSATPGTVVTVAVAGLNAGETLVGIDFRPTTGELFGFGVNETSNTGTVYRLDPQTGTATAIGTAGGVAFVDSVGTAIDFPAPSAGYGFDFNPTVDRIRVTTGTGLNFRLNPVNGNPVDSDTNATGTNPDPNLNGATTTVDGAAYTNSSGTPTVTTLYTIDSVSNALYIQNPANAGTETNQIAITAGGSTLDFGAVNGFDIPFNVSVATSNSAVTSGSAFAVLLASASNHLYSINMVTGAATDLGAVGDGNTALAGLAVGQSTIR